MKNNIEESIKTQLVVRGFTREQLLDNRGLIGAVMDETILHITKNGGESPIDKVTVNNLSAALRVCGISLKDELIDKIIDLVELIEDKGDQTSLKDLCDLQVEWGK